MHNDFTLFVRKYPNGKRVVFYFAYDETDTRVGPWTTKCLTKTAARNYCNRLLKAGLLVQVKQKVFTFGEYAEGFWERESEYIKKKEGRRDITDHYILRCKKYLQNQIIPFFGECEIDEITEKDIDAWLLGFRERKEKVGEDTVIKRYKNSYANSVFSVLSIMLGEAVKRGVIKANPCDNVLKLKNDRKKLEILTLEEERRLLPDNYKKVWGDNEIAYAVNKLASITGMRVGEILGLKGEYVFDNSILVCGQFSEDGIGYKDYTKTKEDRYLPLMPEMIALIRKLMKKNGKGFVFSKNGGASPVSRAVIYYELHKALNKIGIDESEIKRRGLTIHCWRHFVNTELQRQGMSIPQVQAVTGHKTLEMTRGRYNHLDARTIDDVIEAQAVIAGKKTTKKSKGSDEAETKQNRSKFKVIKKPEIEPERKRA